VILAVAVAFALDLAVELRTDPTKLSLAQVGVEHLYARRYPEAQRHFEDLRTRYPTSGIGPLGLAILYQERNFEHEDLRYAAPYEKARDACRAQVAEGMAIPGDEAFESFVLAAVLGLDAIDLLRRESWLAALARAYDGMHMLERTKAAAPRFVDPLLGDGIFYYWRTLVARRSPLIPNFQDRRAEALGLMQRVEAEGAFLGPGASLALAYAWLEEGRPELALAQTDRLARRYPGNVLNQVSRYEILLAAQRYDEALGVVLALDAGVVPRVHFHRGVAYGRLGRWSEAAEAYESFLRADAPTGDRRAQAAYRAGDAWLRVGRRDRAEVLLVEAAGLGHRPARDRLKKLDSP